ncbi:uncharacterized protein PGTG_13878 [Puccinia graminis f. sp. tritici CRL 75-36-700-3]|uniref:F-box domain-containing protein n=1 Tax=Puccinia graminis f. sp. tritici (strain CRL 75-36-700-3 / race SCCL) TaxID=418459 RepID=E3KT82_PUCGT|nr:uncharacterized protein PGTG_13878 [Puccinia graminis f. sp. tritici CRL 75-36-700-3]EFP87507.2 hypothetical protein PGTG_13878 [Puccinia graminis f. sp. tritici CRL 75-36-700-3]
MSFKPSKKQFTKRPAASATSNDKATGPTLASPASEDTPDRPRKSFFSFKASTKRSTSRPAVNHVRPDNSGVIQFPSLGQQNLPSEPPSTNSAFQLEIPVRNLRSSILFSQQFDLKKLGTHNESLHRDPSPTPLMSDIPSRPLRSTTRPASWMMMNDGTYAPPIKAQVQSGTTSGQAGPETFYNGSRISNRFESSDEDGPSHRSAGSGIHLSPAVPQPQQSAKLIGVLAGYQVQPTPASTVLAAQAVPGPAPTTVAAQAVPAPGPTVAAQAVPGRLQPPITIHSQSDPRPALPPSPSRPAAPTASPQNSTYSPLAAFLGQAKSNVPAVLSKSAVPAAPQSVSKAPLPSSLLSAFLGSQSSTEEKAKSSNESPLAATATARPALKPSISLPKVRSSEGTSSARLNTHSAGLSPASARTPASERSSLVQESVNDAVSERSPPISPRPSPSPVGKPDVTTPKTPEVIYPTGGSSPADNDQAPKLETAVPSAIPVPISVDTSVTRSSWSSPCYSSSIRSESVLNSVQPSTTSTSPMPATSVLSHAPEKPSPAKRGRSRKRSVEKVYLDSCSQHSSSSSDNYSSVDGLADTKDRHRKGGSDQSGAVTDPSSACSHSSSPPARNLEKYRSANLDEKKPVSQAQAKSEVHEQGNELKAEKGDDNVVEVSDHLDEAAEGEDQTTPQPKIKFEQLVCHPDIFRKIICHLDYLDFFSLSQISHEFQEELEDDPRLREIILKRYLSGFGYRSLSPHFKIGHRQRELVTIGLKDLANFYAGLEFESLELIGFAKQALKPKGLDYRTAKMIRSSTRAHNKLVAYIRAVEELDPVPAMYRHVGRSEEPVYRSQVWSYLKKGDVCWNLAIGDFGNEGKLLFDGRFLRDLLFEFDDVGHLPSWLNMLEFPPSYFHKIISSSTSSPIFYLDLSSFKEEIKKTLRLSEDKIEVASPQARYRVQRWVYRSVIKIPHGQWQGYVVIEVEGTSEHANDLLRRCCVHSDGTQLHGESCEKKVGRASFGSDRSILKKGELEEPRQSVFTNSNSISHKHPKTLFRSETSLLTNLSQLFLTLHILNRSKSSSHNNHPLNLVNP